MDGEMKLPCPEYSALPKGADRFVVAQHLFPIIQGCKTSRTFVYFIRGVAKAVERD